MSLGSEMCIRDRGKVVGINRKERTAAVQLSPDNTIQVEWEELVDASQADNV